MIEVGAFFVKTRLSSLLNKVAPGDQIIVCRLHIRLFSLFRLGTRRVLQS